MSRMLVTILMVLLTLSTTVVAARSATGTSVAQRHESEVHHGDHRAGAHIAIGVGDPGPTKLETSVWADPLAAGQLPSPDTDGPEQPDADQDQSAQLPNLVPLPASTIVIDEADGPLSTTDYALGQLGGTEEEIAGPVLRFTSTIMNTGTHSFELVGVPGRPDPETDTVLTAEAYQCLGWEGPDIENAQRICPEYARVGTMTYHAHHRHFHIDGFARYQLRRDRHGRPMHGPGSVLAESGKVGWCVSDMMRHIAQGERPEPMRAWYRECTSGPSVAPLSNRMGISPGWMDVYPWGFAGQQLPLKGVQDGVYWLSIWINPPDNPFGLTIRESHHLDNISYRRIRISGNGTEVEEL